MKIWMMNPSIRCEEADAKERLEKYDWPFDEAQDFAMLKTGRRLNISQMEELRKKNLFWHLMEKRRGLFMTILTNHF